MRNKGAAKGAHGGSVRLRLQGGRGRISLRRARRIAVMFLRWHGRVQTQSLSQADLQEETALFACFGA